MSNRQATPVGKSHGPLPRHFRTDPDYNELILPQLAPIMLEIHTGIVVKLQGSQTGHITPDRKMLSVFTTKVEAATIGLVCQMHRV